MPFRNYLMEFVVPTLNEGLLEVSNIIPNDPVDLLAEYLYQKSYDVWKVLAFILVVSSPKDSRLSIWW